MCAEFIRIFFFSSRPFIFTANAAQIQWKNNFVPFIDALLHFSTFQLDTRKLCVPVEIKNMAINVRTHYGELEKLNEENPGTVKNNDQMNF